VPAGSFHYHHARLVELLRCLERLEAPLRGPEILSPRVRSLAGLAGVMFGAVPPVVLVGVGGGSFADGERLSPAVERAVPEVVEAVARVVADPG
jgi:hypothetical protein